MSDSQGSNETTGVGRREFLRIVGAAGIASAMPAAAIALAQAGKVAPAPPAAADSLRAPAAAPTDSAAAAPKGPSEEARALAAILRARFPDRLTEEQWKSVTEDLDYGVASGKRLAARKLANGEEPDTVFHA